MQQDQDRDRPEDFDEKRHEQLTTAPKAVESDAAPRVEVSEPEDGVTRIDVAETASVRPGTPSPTRDA
ncbi:hypothetical protein BFL36_04400 [Clavibacter michiganensis]|uniref:Multidrug transporter n=1 Tax=Clavibacter michiganensis TaxID=28447 RepID=A0A251YQN5_9MICO|nr:hypothetical protein [Clavibacter michiganensis]OUE26453.1 hypothetical protein BFL36_04400 [Clavibacter michiganensis]